MTTNPSPNGARLIESMKEALAYVAGDTSKGSSIQKPYIEDAHVPESIDVKSLRERLHMSQTAFAHRFALNLSTVRNWEYGRRQPDSTAKAYLYLIEKNPDLVETSLRQ